MRGAGHGKLGLVVGRLAGEVETQHDVGRLAGLRIGGQPRRSGVAAHGDLVVGRQPLRIGADLETADDHIAIAVRHLGLHFDAGHDPVRDAGRAPRLDHQVVDLGPSDASDGRLQVEDFGVETATLDRRHGAVAGRSEMAADQCSDDVAGDLVVVERTGLDDFIADLAGALVAAHLENVPVAEQQRRAGFTIEDDRAHRPCAAVAVADAHPGRHGVLPRLSIFLLRRRLGHQLPSVAKATLDHVARHDLALDDEDGWDQDRADRSDRLR